MSMASITALSHLNLSHNLLSGPIPTTNQFSTFNDPSIYEANLGLCGLSLLANCTPPNNQNDQDDKQDEDDRYMTWFFINMAMGFPVAFWVVCGSLALNKSWRHAYFMFIDEIMDRLCLYYSEYGSTQKEDRENWSSWLKRLAHILHHFIFCFLSTSFLHLFHCIFGVMIIITMNSTVLQMLVWL